jgi:hypothetical protein
MENKTMILTWFNMYGENKYFLPYANGLTLINCLLPTVNKMIIYDYDSYHAQGHNFRRQ